ncbi:hypothetical protein JX266_013805 [Neoarthrinium moseri]|nr:hypothetical protein JX266_013805 [Neoarthrinium moseri]
MHYRRITGHYDVRRITAPHESIVGTSSHSGRVMRKTTAEDQIGFVSKGERLVEAAGVLRPSVRDLLKVEWQLGYLQPPSPATACDSLCAAGDEHDPSIDSRQQVGLLFALRHPTLEYE